MSLACRRAAEARYLRARESYQQVLDTLAREVQGFLEQEGLRVSVRARVKSFESLFRKLLDRFPETGGNGGEAAVNDLLGIRLICPFLGDLKAAESILRRRFVVLEVERKGEEQSYREFGYDSTHLLIRVPTHIQRSAHVRSNPICEVQVRTTLQEAWAEIEHELVYKAELAPLDEPMRRKLASLKATLTLSDNIFQEIRDYQRQVQDALRLRKSGLWARILNIAARQGPGGEASCQPHGELRSVGGGKDDRRAMESEPVLDIDGMLLKALSAHNRQELPEALRLYSLILGHDLAPRARTIVLLHRGTAHFQHGNLGEAREDFSEALRLDDSSERAYFLLGITRWALGEGGEAMLDFSRSLERNPLQVDVLACRALLRCEMGDSAGALADTEQVLAIAPDSPEAADLQELLTVEATGRCRPAGGRDPRRSG
ncbi:MAG: tetratricopeptide repeat protein [Spirochaetales bacterium]|nr:tetratricopeptide repeat protein [Spirochaetales bacterium]